MHLNGTPKAWLTIRSCGLGATGAAARHILAATKQGCRISILTTFWFFSFIKTVCIYIPPYCRRFATLQVDLRYKHML
uniref:Uncharacterized protein n=1 Tax=Setaria italica TaxID=4555 RepID=K3ZBE0_SETIT